MYRTIVLPASAFDTKQRFLDTLREKFGGGTFNFSKGVTADDLADYCAYLKEDFQNGDIRRTVYFTSYIGFQCDSYWMLSKKVRSFMRINAFIYCYKSHDNS